MVRNYIITALRNIQRKLIYFIINLAGLSIGITCCLLIMVFIHHEISYDQFHTKKDRLYRVNYDIVMGGNEIISPSVPVFVGPYLKRSFPEVENVTRFENAYAPRTLSYGDKIFEEKRFAWVDPDFFKLLSFEKLKGDLGSALSRPKTLVITSSTAKKYFGEEDPIGKTLTDANQIAYEITAVIEDVPSMSHFTFDILTSIYSQEGIDDETVQWNNPNYTTFVLLKPGADIHALQSKVNDWVNPPQEKKTSDNSLTLVLEPLSQVHFNTHVFNFQGNLSITDSKYLYIFGAIAFLILIIACINYINLSTARASTRAKEVGIRKTSGANFEQIVIQVLTESFCVLLPAIIISLVATNFLLPLLNELAGKSMSGLNWRSPEPFLFLIGGWILMSLLAGFYPALVLSKFKPIAVLKGKIGSASGGTLRKGLVIVQFAISVVLIVASFVVFSQLHYMQSKKLGLDKESLLFIRGNRNINPVLDAFIQKLKQIPGVENACGAWRSPFETVVGNGFNLSPNPDNEGWVTVGGIFADQDYIPTLGIELLAGRNFDPAKVKDTVSEFIVNEAFLRDFNLTSEEAIGKQVTLGIVRDHGPGTIIGIVKDFHITSLHEQIRPVVLFNNLGYRGGTILRLAPGDIQHTLRSIEKEWKSLVPQRPFNYTFLDDEYDALYRTEQRVSKMAGIFSGIAIFVACLGLLALASFTSLQRAKEISIRKVLGANSYSIVFLLSKGYLQLLMIAFIIAVPLSYYLADQWLENFAFRITIGPLYFVIAFFSMGLLSLITVGYQSFRASAANPTENLRLE